MTTAVRPLDHDQWERALTVELRELLRCYDLIDTATGLVEAHTARIDHLIAEGFRHTLPEPRTPQ